MIKITDRTLSCLDDFAPSANQLRRLIELFALCDADCIELSQKMYRILGELPPFGSYLLRIEHIEEANDFRAFDKFICKRNFDEEKHVYGEIFVNDFRDSGLIMQHQYDRMLRITGLDDLFRQSVASSMEHLKNVIPKNTEFCAGNSFGCGTAAVVEWLNANCSKSVVTSFSGIGGFAPFEEVLIALRQIFRRHPQTDYEFLPEIRNIISEITDIGFNKCIPVIGEGIFTVESGIHIAGILRHPKCYEPFTPESVGKKREFTYGKFSGRSGIKHKLSEMNINVTEEELNIITLRVKTIHQIHNHSISDDGLFEIIQEIRNSK